MGVVKDALDFRGSKLQLRRHHSIAAQLEAERICNSRSIHTQVSACLAGKMNVNGEDDELKHGLVGSSLQCLHIALDRWSLGHSRNFILHWKTSNPQTKFFCIRSAILLSHLHCGLFFTWQLPQIDREAVTLSKQSSLRLLF